MRLSALLCSAASTLEIQQNNGSYYLSSGTAPVPCRPDVSPWPSSRGLLIIYMASSAGIVVIILPNELNSQGPAHSPELSAAGSRLERIVFGTQGSSGSCVLLLGAGNAVRPEQARALGPWAVPVLPQQQPQGDRLQHGASRLQACKIVTVICNYNQRITFQPARRRWEPAARCRLITADTQGWAH